LSFWILLLFPSSFSFSSSFSISLIFPIILLRFCLVSWNRPIKAGSLGWFGQSTELHIGRVIEPHIEGLTKG
jgi:hypothetical protein